MQKEKQIKVIDASGQILFQCDIPDRDKAFDYAKEMEAMGIEIQLIEPSLPETLANSLGINNLDREKLREEILNEIEEHDLGCCLQKNKDD